jgi:putative colanic acid biosynthesis UDP-glucose lipid carrier transferase
LLLFDAPIGVSKPSSTTTLVRAPAACSRLKRLSDVAFGLTMLVFLAPLLMVLCLMIKLDSKGPALFRQRRTGLGGRVFTILKLRTMSVMEDGDRLQYAVKGDERVTRLGRLLRRSSLDELPQLFNVIVGDMSLVGPRPHALAHDIFYSEQIPRYQERFCARPGLTGLAQVRGLRGGLNEAQTMTRRVEQDLLYVEKWSLWLDLWIIIQTIPSLLIGRGVY